MPDIDKGLFSSHHQQVTVHVFTPQSALVGEWNKFIVTSTVLASSGAGAGRNGQGVDVRRDVVCCGRKKIRADRDEWSQVTGAVATDLSRLAILRTASELANFLDVRPIYVWRPTDLAVMPESSTYQALESSASYVQGKDLCPGTVSQRIVHDQTTRSNVKRVD
jgi:hypothetical protein